MLVNRKILKALNSSSPSGTDAHDVTTMGMAMRECVTGHSIFGGG
jgi:hypothetical protein